MTHADGILAQLKMGLQEDGLSLSTREAVKRRIAEMDDTEPPTAEELMAEFGYEPGEPPNPIHGEVTGELDRYGYPWIHVGGRDSYHARKIWKDKLDRAGYRWHHPEDERFSEDVDVRTVVVTGREADD